MAGVDEGIFNFEAWFAMAKDHQFFRKKAKPYLDLMATTKMPGKFWGNVVLIINREPDFCDVSLYTQKHRFVHIRLQFS